MKIAMYPGSFDPVTMGHIDVINRSAKLFDKLIVVVMKNSNKKPLFSVDERVKLIADAVKHISNVTVTSYNGLLVDFAKENGISTIVKGLRAISDFECEFQMAAINQKLSPDLDSVFIMTRVEYMYISSSMVKEVASYGGDISSLVSPNVLDAILSKYKEQEN